tara:strand:+ start:2498 stop:7228 length:4731 start_codon:yes stop_codon:yes gene_type:complete
VHGKHKNHHPKDWKKIEWPKQIPSFELWAHMTCYDDPIAFQQLMALLLGAGQNTIGDVQRFDVKGGKAKNHYYSLQDDYGSIFKEGVTNKPEDENFDIKTAWVHAGNSVRGQTKVTGLVNGTRSNNNLSGFPLRTWETNPSFAVYSRMDWLKKFNLRTGKDPTGNTATADDVKDMGKNSTHQQLFSKGFAGMDNQGAVCQESGSPAASCMANANNIAAIYGLYYYKDSDKCEWVKEHTVRGKTYKIRMRKPNPQYIYVAAQGALYVHEPNNKKNQVDLDAVRVQYGPHTHLGGTYPDVKPLQGKNFHCFRLPVLGQMDKLAVSSSKLGISPLKFLTGWRGGKGNDVTDTSNSIIAPWWGHEFIDTQPSWFRKNGAELITVRTNKAGKVTSESRTNSGNITHARKTAANLHAALGDLVHLDSSTEDAMMFGFNISCAHLLYPHSVGEKETISDESSDPASAQIGWMHLPVLKHENNRKDLAAPAQGVSMASYLLDIKEPKDENAARMFYLSPARKVSHLIPIPTTASTAAAEGGGDVLDDADASEGADADSDAEDPDADAPAAADSAAIEGRDDDRDVDLPEDYEVVNDEDAALQKELPEYEVESAGMAQSDTTNHDDAKQDQEKTATLKPPPTIKEVQHRFNSEFRQPWRHDEIYNPARFNIEALPMTAAEVATHKDKHGHTGNLYVGGYLEPKKLVLKPVWGDVREDVWNSVVTANQLNLAKIMCIYVGDTGISGYGDKLTVEMKRKFMREGVFRPKNNLSVIMGKPTKNYTQIWGPVFTLPKVWQKVTGVKLGMHPKLLTFLNKYCDKSSLHRVDELEHALSEASTVRTLLGLIESTMTVKEWVTTPWHYEHLPMRVQHALFRQGETYSDGCRRCSRRFHEFPEKFAADNSTPDGTKHWPQLMWSAKKDSDCSARRPFHDPELWPAAFTHTKARTLAGRSGTALRPGETKEQRKAAETAHAATSYAPVGVQQGNVMQWPSKKFTTENLHPSEYGNKPKRIAHFKNEPRFRQYVNHAYNGPTDTIPQGRVKLNARVPFMVVDYKLQRSHKYGNLCADCCTVLDKAQLVVRLRTRVDPNVALGGAFERSNKGTHSKNKQSSQWLSMQTYMHQKFGEMIDMSLILAYRGASTLAQARFTKPQLHEIEKQKEIVVAGMLELFQNTLTAAPNVSHIHRTAQIHTQNIVSIESTTAPEAEVEVTLAVIRRLLAGGGPSGTILKIALEAPTFRDIMRHALHEYENKFRVNKVDPTVQFDSDVKRLEYRNSRLVKKKNDLTVDGIPLVRGDLGKVTLQRLAALADRTYENVLMTVQMIPLHKKASKRQVEIYLSGSAGQWAGDAYAIRKGTGNKDFLRQVRTMRQSRLFITYSLHRPTTDERVARKILETMNEACHELFGNDNLLSRILVFGYQIGKFSVGAQQRDAVSSSKWELITKTRKEDAMKDFYGEAGETSYQYDTYETHIDRVTVDGGVEIGPKMKHPHFHILLTLNHWGYVQLDYFKMNAILELMFKGINGPFNWGEKFFLDAGDGTCFYTDNENPYVDVKLYPADNWANVLAAYVRKNAVPSQMEALTARAGIA